MKLLYVTEDRYPPFRADVVELFARQLPNRGHCIEWLMQRGPDALSTENPSEWLGNRVYLTPRSKQNGLLGRIINNILGIFGDCMILPLALHTRYDVIQVRDKVFAGFIAWFAARLTGAKFVHWMSYPFPESKLYEARAGLVTHPKFVFLKWGMAYTLLYGFNLRVADHVFVQSERMKQDVAEKGIPVTNMTHVPMGIRTDQVGVAEDAKLLDTDSPLLLHLGIIQKIRQSDMLVRVLQQVRARYPHARLLYVGEGQQTADRQAVIDEAGKLGLADAVTITGFLPMEQAWEWVRKADVCFSPFYPTPVLLSTSPTKLIEYLAMAKNVVANEHPEQCQVLSDSAVGHCIPWDEKAFADEVCRLLDDPESARQAAARGPEWVRNNRTYDVIADHVAARYADLLRPTT